MTKKEITKLDRLSREKAKEHYGTRCLICGRAGYINIHHYYGRRLRACRWYIPNLVPLCPNCHTFGLWSAHQNPEHFRTQMLDLRGKKWLDDLTAQSNKVFKGNADIVKKYLDGETLNYC